MFYPVRVPLLSVVIPTFSARGLPLIEKCLRSLAYTHGHLSEYMEVIVVEDSEEPDIPDHIQRIASMNGLKIQFANQPNGGFAKACNRGMNMASGQVVFLVNNDIEFTGQTLQVLSDAVVATKAGVVGTRLLYPDYSLQHAGVVFVPVQPSEANQLPGYFDHILRHQQANHFNAVQMRPGLVTGALFGIRRETIEMVGLLDERFGMSCEDVDYCLRTIEIGMDTLYCGYPFAIHAEGATRGRTPEEKAQMAPAVWEKEKMSLALLFDKWNGINWGNFMAQG